jgi:hypothetical protein
LAERAGFEGAQEWLQANSQKQRELETVIAGLNR